MKHNVLITPLNCGIGTGMNNYTFLHDGEYQTAKSKATFIKSPTTSYFKMKSQQYEAYLEPTFYSLQIGDIVEVEFDALSLSGDNAYIKCNFLQMSETYTTSELTLINATGNLESYFKKYKLRYYIPKGYNGIGLVLNIRVPVGSEVVVKNINVSIETSNSEFSCKTDVIRYSTKTDYMKCIDFVAGTNLKESYNTLQTEFDTGAITFPDNKSVNFGGDNVTHFKGLIGLFSNSCYRRSICCYVEYKTDTSSTLISLTRTDVKEDETLSSQNLFDFPATNNVWKKKISYFVANQNDVRKFFIDLGRISANGFTFKEVIFASPQNDDYLKIEPNDLTELYTDLRVRLK